MRYISFTRCGLPGFGVHTDKGIADLTGRLDPRATTLAEALRLRVLHRTADLDLSTADFSQSDVTLLPVIPAPGKIICIGLNYESHRAETKRPDALYPTVFTRFADSQVAHGQDLIRPKVSRYLDYEGELAVIIGKGGRYIEEAQAMEHVAGYACYNDITVRDWQRHTHQFTPGKTFPGTGAFGPWMVSADEIDDYRTLGIRTRVNGETMQDSDLSHLIFSIPRLIAYCSSFTPLQPGDVIVTGTPGGVGDRRDPPLYLEAGDVIEVEIDRIGLLRNVVVDEQ